MNYSYVPISNVQLLVSLILVLVTGAISAALNLGLLKSLLWGTVRAFIQLTFIGYILKYVFQFKSLLVILPIILVMSFIAAREATGRIKKTAENNLGQIFISIVFATFLVGLIVVIFIISPQPWYTPQVLIPIFGMILGNSMNGIALTLDRLYGQVYDNIEKIEEMLAAGAAPREAIQSYMQNAVKAGMIPTINGLMVVGLVSLPGMMTGQILAGMNPQEAVKYQFVVMIMIAAAVGIACVLVSFLTYPRLFNQNLALNENIKRGTI